MVDPLSKPPPPRAGMIAALVPLRIPMYRLLWLTWLAANTTMWMNDVGSAWLMTSLSDSPLMVALVQSASTLPVFLLGLPSGALADTLDRRRYLIVTQFWAAGIACLISLTVMMGWMTPPLLLALTFANGVGLAMRWPVFAATVPELVPRSQLPAAMALNGIGMNVSRIVGPLMAGAIIASVGSAWVFALNAVLSVAAAIAVIFWRREHKPSPLGRERLPSAMRVGVQFVWQSRRMRVVITLISLCFFHFTALLALLPLVARSMPGGNAGTFTLLLAAMGVGSIFAALQMPRLRQVLSFKALLMVATALQGTAMLMVAWAPSIYVMVPAMFIAGMAWISLANSLAVRAQMSLPDWVRARGMSIYQMSLMGATAAGAALWGQVATWTNIHDSLSIAAISSVVTMIVAQRMTVDWGIEEDLTPARGVLRSPLAEAPPRPGRIQVSIEYRIDPARVDEFMALMQESRRSRMGHGVLDWQVMQDLYEPGRIIEQITDESWTEHLRRFDRVTAADVQVRERKLAYHIGDEPPVVTRYVVDR